MQISTWLERAVVGCLFIIAIFAPHSIAVTQAAWLLGMVLWVARLAIYPRPSLSRSPVDYALVGFFILSGISSIFSYSQTISIGKMRAASLFTIVYLISQNAGSLRLVRLLALALIGSCMINVFLTAGQLAIGRGVKVVELSGGNQQKVVIAKSLAQEPSLIIFDEPTRGVDVGAIVEIHDLINRLADEGKAVVVISSYLPEILAISDRILVCRQGKVVEEFSAVDVTEEKIMYAAIH